MPSRSLRLAVAFALLLLLPGCLGAKEQPRLAQPTDKPIVVPLGPPTPTPVKVDLNDPGYTVNGTWDVGDGWDYESNRSRTMRMRVLEARAEASGTLYLVETTWLSAQGALEARTRSWIDGRTWTRVNATDEKGVVDRYFPGLPERYYKNGTASFDHTRVDAQGRLLANESVRLQSVLHAKHETIQAKFGEYYETRKVEQVFFATAKEGGARTRSTMTHWVHRAVLHDVAFQLESGEKFVLTAFKADEVKRGTLAS